jgi:hypothetical protein
MRLGPPTGACLGVRRSLLHLLSETTSLFSHEGPRPAAVQLCGRDRLRHQGLGRVGDRHEHRGGQSDPLHPRLRLRERGVPRLGDHAQQRARLRDRDPVLPVRGGARKTRPQVLESAGQFKYITNTRTRLQGAIGGIFLASMCLCALKTFAGADVATALWDVSRVPTFTVMAVDGRAPHLFSSSSSPIAMGRIITTAASLKNLPLGSGRSHPDPREACGPGVTQSKSPRRAERPPVTSCSGIQPHDRCERPGTMTMGCPGGG